MSQLFKKSVFISLLSHITLLGVFNLSFNPVLPKANYTAVSFWGSWLPADFLRAPRVKPSSLKMLLPSPEPDTRLLRQPDQRMAGAYDYYVKPHAMPASLNADKISYVESLASSAPPVKKGAVLMFYPPLPHNFSLYFKDRQAVHIELMFRKASPADSKTNALIVKRKISSGNLEADLLTMRYLGRYLFMQQRNLPLDAWQTVKIELSPQK
ncbi:MAG TPA: hypothetical protein VMD52_03095 [Patescibacteria group bacterium]|nr:hypothetical protein [Patescibacteria group bacterium]